MTKKHILFLFLTLVFSKTVSALSIPDTVVFLEKKYYSLTKVPQNNPITYKKIELGKILFFDKQLSSDKTISCGSCHNPSLAFTDGKVSAIGIGGVRGNRNTPTIINRIFSQENFWDGRAKSLEEQVLLPIQNQKEMALNHKYLLEILKSSTTYPALFSEAFQHSGITLENTAKALSSYIRSLVYLNSRVDQFISGEKNALSNSEIRGMLIFQGKGRCAVCHTGINFSDERYYNIGILSNDPGRFNVTKKTEDYGAFKTPTLRQVKLTAPYFHNGSQATLKEVIQFYNNGGELHSNKSKLIAPLDLTNREQEDLVNFVLSLSQ